MLTRLLAERGDLNTLTNRADNGDRFAAVRLVRLLVDRGDAAKLRIRARKGERGARLRLAELRGHPPVPRGDAG